MSVHRTRHTCTLRNKVTPRSVKSFVKTKVSFLRWAGYVARMGEERGVNRVLVGKPEGRRLVGRPRRRWVGNIRKDLQEVGCGYME